MTYTILYIILIISTLLFAASCGGKSHNWPRGMTPFFAECEGEGGTYTDKAYAKRKQSPCPGGWKFFDRGEPTLIN